MSVLENGKAINIALIPDEKSERILRDLSEELTEQGGEGLLIAGKTEPHLSLWMGLLELEELEHLHSWVESFDLKIILHHPELILVPSGDGSRLVSQVKFEDNDLIGYLHRTIHERMDGMRSLRELRGEQFAGGAVSESSLSYCSDFHEEHSGTQYRPHVTIGYGELKKNNSLEAMVFDRVGLYQLGNHCTCVKEL